MKYGAIYEGEWKHGKANGKGKQQYQDSYIKETLTSNQLQGEAAYVNGTEIYKGYWLNRIYKGIDEYVISDGRIQQDHYIIQNNNTDQVKRSIKINLYMKGNLRKV